MGSNRHVTKENVAQSSQQHAPPTVVPQLPQVQQQPVEVKSNEEGLAEHAERLRKFQRLGNSMIQMGPPRFDNNTTSSLQSQPWIQRKLTIGELGDKYEQEADRVASQVVQQINAPASKENNIRQSIQREKDLEGVMYARGFQAAIQRKQAIESGEVSPDLESGINRVRGSGQPLDAGLQQSMGQAMGADFSGVRVHADAQSDQLNQSIQARAFTTGQDVFFREGAYQPENRGGQELIAHELTHVVQQNGGRAMQLSHLSNEQQYSLSSAESFLKDGEGLETQNVAQVPKHQDASVARHRNYVDYSTSNSLPTGILQREVFKSRSGPNKGKFYSSFDQETFFDNREEAQKHNYKLSKDRKRKLVEEKQAKSEERSKKRRRLAKEKYGDIKPPSGKKVKIKLTTGKIKEASFYNLKLGDVKKHVNDAFIFRKMGSFKEQVICLGGEYFILYPGTDIGVVPALRHEENLFQRLGSAKPYAVLAKTLDSIVECLKNNEDMSLKEARQRVGSDIMRRTRGSKYKEPDRKTTDEKSDRYTEDQKTCITEVATVLRLDKGRVPGATKYIRKTFTDGEMSFNDLLVKNKYVGAPSGGVANLRKKIKEGGEDSDGSDMEEEDLK